MPDGLLLSGNPNAPTPAYAGGRRVWPFTDWVYWVTQPPSTEKQAPVT